MNKSDLRVIKTERALALAMLKLLETRNFSKITVKDLCGEAMVSRSAFYAHFEDKYALLIYCIDVLGQKMFESERPLDLYSRLCMILTRVQEKQQLLRHLMLSELDAELVSMLKRLFHESLSKRIADFNVDICSLPGPIDIVLTYYAAGITSAVMRWLTEGMKYSIEEMARCICALLPESLNQKSN